MIEPSKVKDAFCTVEKENYSFRRYLKNHADEKELDEQFLELHDQLFSGYDCSKCRNCCKEYAVCFEEEELNPVAAFLRITEAEFKDVYIKEKFGELQLNVTPCCFLEVDGSCRIESCKPSSCRDYPFTNRPERLYSLLNIIESAGVCPVMYELIERLKLIYRFNKNL